MLWLLFIYGAAWSPRLCMFVCLVLDCWNYVLCFPSHSYFSVLFCLLFMYSIHHIVLSWFLLSYVFVFIVSLLLCLCINFMLCLFIFIVVVRLGVQEVVVLDADVVGEGLVADNAVAVTNTANANATDTYTYTKACCL